MIIGTGMDIVHISRIKSVYEKYSDHFAKRILTALEYDEFAATNHKVRYLAKRFAAKEAVAKAMGTGFRQGISPRMIQIKNIETGQPVIELIGAAKIHADKMGVNASWISISDEKQYAAAMAIMEKL